MVFPLVVKFFSKAVKLTQPFDYETLRNSATGPTFDPQVFAKVLQKRLFANCTILTACRNLFSPLTSFPKDGNLHQ